MSTPEQNPHPLGLTADAFLRAFPSIKGGSLAAYRRMMREGAQDLPAFRLAPISRQLRESSPEGEVIKFVQSLGTSALRAESPGASALRAEFPPLPPPFLLPPSPDTRSFGSESRTTHEIESVLIPMIGRGGIPSYTLCLSSQVGCAMGCTFCETAQMGLIRSLEPHEIVGQWFAAAHLIGIRPKNIVFMGMGEPLDNLHNVLAAIAVLTDHNGAHVAMNKITVSTVGRIDGLKRLAAKIHEPGWHRLNLAVSINAPNDEVRSRLMPINRGMPMADLRDAILAMPKYGGAKVCIEYVLIPGINDAPEHARELAEYVRPLSACVNLIPYNPRRNSPWPAPTEERVGEFLGWLTDAGCYAKRRRTKGRDMMGACGQLGNPQIRKRQLVPITTSA